MKKRFQTRLKTRLLARAVACCLLLASTFASVASAQTAGIAPPPASGYRVAGTVVSRTEGHPLFRTRVSLTEVKDPRNTQSVITSEDGKFEFTRLPAGKYSLRGERHGFIPAAYDEHGFFSTAIVTGAGLDTENLTLRLAPDGVITGKVLDEAGEPVRNAMVLSYINDHRDGADQIHGYISVPTDDLGAFEMSPLMPGTYFLSAQAHPWYAIHPPTQPPGATARADPSSLDRSSFDRSLDVAYPLTYYADVTEPESATPIPIRGGERLQVEIHLNPVPSLHLLFRVPVEGNTQPVPQLQQPGFDSPVSVPGAGTNPISPGLMEIMGIPAGRYDVRIGGGDSGAYMSSVDLGKDGEEIDMSRADALGQVRVSVRVQGESTLSPRLMVGLRLTQRSLGGSAPVNAKGEGEIEGIAPGKYEVVAWDFGRPFSVLHLTAEGAEVSGHMLTVPAGASPSVALTLVRGGAEVRGVVKKSGKALAGAMIVLVPKDAALNRDLFRLDQSDLDGTFSLPRIVPGSYTLVAIDDGWDLEWSHPGVMDAYLKRGRAIKVSGQHDRPIELAEPVEAQSK